MPGIRFGPVVPWSSKRTRSGRITSLTGPIASRSPRWAVSSNVPRWTRPPSPCRPSARADIRFDTPRKSATYAVAGSS